MYLLSPLCFVMKRVGVQPTGTKAMWVMLMFSAGASRTTQKQRGHDNTTGHTMPHSWSQTSTHPSVSEFFCMSLENQREPHRRQVIFLCILDEHLADSNLEIELNAKCFRCSYQRITFSSQSRSEAVIQWISPFYDLQCSFRFVWTQAIGYNSRKEKSEVH